MSIRLGPFELYEPIGRGGRAYVWRGMHVEREIAVAVKVMTASTAQQPRFQRAFRKEVRAVARLHHPGIVMVFDCREVTAGEARQQGANLIAGSPYLAMELGMGTLSDVQHLPLSFEQQRILLLRVLDALAYAHARGVIHRDIKPENLLVVSQPEGPRLKLADFGLAHALDDESPKQGSTERISGTPRYVAPEQIVGDWRNQGPWTDLYALGCVAYWMTSASPPFDGADTQQILKSHLREPIPPLEPTEPMPEGYVEWIEKLLAKDRTQRFQRAADAAHALRSIGGADRVLNREITIPIDVGDEDTPQVEEVTDGERDTIALPRVSAASIEAPHEKVCVDGPPIPETWRRTEHRRPDDQVMGAGLGLFGLREVPMVDRDEERDAIWHDLLTVQTQRDARAVILRGPAGVGKSRLAQWMAERAHEVGAATVLKANHGPMGTPGHGLAKMLSTHLRCSELTREEVLERVQSAFSHNSPLDKEDHLDCLAVTEIIARLIAADPDASTRRVHFADRRERYAALVRFIDRIADGRPVIIWLDDVHWSDDSLGLVDFALESHEINTPMLFLLTADDEDLHRLPQQTSLLTSLQSDDLVRTIALESLADEDHRAIVGGLLRLDESLADEVVERTAGNPLFAVQLVGDWVERHLLIPSPLGYRLRPGERVDLPDTIHQLLVDRLQRVLDMEPPARREQAQLALELAAALGRSVDLQEWGALCKLRRLKPAMASVEDLIGAGLARRTRGGWQFAHDAIRECLQRLAERQQRWQPHHRACAQMLRTLYQPGERKISLRLARHLWRAGDLDETIEPLLEAARHARSACEPRRAHTLLDKRTGALDDLGASRRDRRRVEGWICRATIYHYEGDLELAGDVLDRSYAMVIDEGWDDLLAECLYAMGMVCRATGETRKAGDYYTWARDQYRRLGDWIGVAKSTHSVGAVLQLLGDFQGAEVSYREGLSHFEKIEDARGLALCYQGLATLQTRCENYDEAVELLQLALDYFEQSGDRLGLSNTFNSLGEVHRRAGDYPTAEEMYRRSVAARRRLGTMNYFVPHFNLVQLLIHLEYFERAHRELHDILGAVTRAGQKIYMGITHVGLLPCSAAAEDWEEWDEHLRQASSLLGETEFVHEDVADLLERATELAMTKDERRRAEEAARLAARQFRAVGEEARAEELLGRLIGAR